MHYIQSKSILSSTNGMNLYRGCSHGCIYCDSRSKCYHINHVFEDIAVKENALELLESALRRKRNKCMIGTGSMCDPYMPIEFKIRNTRGSMELCYKYGFGYTLITKSARVLEDLDIISKINSDTKCVIQMTLTTANEELCKILEPNVSTTKERFEALKVLRDHNIPTVVWLCPILPFINDTEENLKAILRYCIETKVKGIICFGMGLTLREGNREYFYSKLDEHFPGLKEKYIKYYEDSYQITSPNNQYLMKLFHGVCERYGIMHDNDAIFNYLHTYENKHKTEQLSLF